MEARNLQVQWLDAGPKDVVFRNILAMIRKGDAGMGLVGSRVQVTTGKVCRWGTIHSYDTHTQLYHIELQDRTQVTLNHEQVTKHWRPATSHSSWTREDQTQLGTQIRKIVGRRTVDVARQLRNPHHTLLQSTTLTKVPKL